MANESKHTPGPWKAGPVFQEEGRAIFYDDTTKPGRWQRRLDPRAGVFAEADARLIAAAPDLLDALAEFMDVMAYAEREATVAGLRHAYDKGRAAIAKAVAA